MAKQRLEDITMDCSKAFKKQYRNDKRALQNGDSRNLEVAINLYNYIEETPGMTRASLAELLDVSQAYLSKVINGNVNLTLGTIEKYEKILSISLLPKPDMKKSCSHDILLSLPRERVHSTETFSFGPESLQGYSFNLTNNGDKIQICRY
jgi:transcriptional regulator with XRE-family HTH domain